MKPVSLRVRRIRPRRRAAKQSLGLSNYQGQGLFALGQH
jgi:hypothetical protein